MTRRTMTTVYIDADDLAALKSLSTVTSVTMSEFVRMWIKQGMYGKRDEHWTRRRIKAAFARAELHDPGEADELETD